MFRRVPRFKFGAKFLKFTRNYSSRTRNNFNYNLSSGIIAGLVIGFGGYKLGKYELVNNPPSNLFPSNSTTKLEDLESPKYASDEQLELAISKIIEIVGSTNVKNSKIEIDHHTKNEFSPHEPKINEKPKYIIYPSSTLEVSKIMKILNEYRVPVVPFSGGTALEGHFYSTRMGVVLNTSKMNRIIKINQDDLDVQVEAGVNWQDLNQVLAKDGLMFGNDCGPNGLISGMINTNASGINASRYGSMIHNVISITVVLADGTIVKTKQRPRKSSAGYNLTGLFIGSEGTLGIVTEAVVRLYVKPKYETVVVGQFPTILDSTNMVGDIFKSGIQPNAIELLDQDMMHCINYSGYTTREWEECPSLFIKIGGMNKVIVDEYIKQLQKIASDNNVVKFIFAKNQEEGEELFSARKNAFYAMLQYARNEIDPDIKTWVTDIAVPISKLSPVLNQVSKIIKSSGFESIILAHAGDGNFHADLFYKLEDEEKCEKIVDELIKIGLQNEGTCTGEHGIGNAKRNFLKMELGEDAINLMRKLKMSLDPNRILNPDKIFKIDPEDDGKY